MQGERERARQLMRCALTRLALSFDTQKKYTGAEVQEILIGSMLSIDEVSDAQAIRIEGQQQLPEPRQR
jgi:hypothetical protein